MTQRVPRPLARTHPPRTSHKKCTKNNRIAYENFPVVSYPQPHSQAPLACLAHLRVWGWRASSGALGAKQPKLKSARVTWRTACGVGTLLWPVVPDNMAHIRNHCDTALSSTPKFVEWPFWKLLRLWGGDRPPTPFEGGGGGERVWAPCRDPLRGHHSSRRRRIPLRPIRRGPLPGAGQTPSAKSSRVRNCFQGH